MTAMFSAIHVITCNHCNVSFSLQINRTIGCGCDPDSPTWIAMDKHGRLMAGSYAEYEVSFNKKFQEKWEVK